MSIRIKYDNGYWPKIEYWASQLQLAVLNGDLRAIDSAHQRLNHFIDQQWKLEFGEE
jgi:hypothetical protein